MQIQFRTTVTAERSGRVSQVAKKMQGEGNDVPFSFGRRMWLEGFLVRSTPVFFRRTLCDLPNHRPMYSVMKRPE